MLSMDDYFDLKSGAADAERCLELLAAAGNAERDAASKLGRTPWWRAYEHWIEHLEARSNRRRLTRLLAGRWDDLAGHVIVSDVRRLHEDRNDPRNPFRPGVLSELESLTSAVVAGEKREWHVQAAAETIEELAIQLTPAAVRAFILAEVDRRQAVARDPRMLSAPGPDGLTVQHQASGLRAQFRTGNSFERFGTVMSKPYSSTLPSIDPATPGTGPEDRSSWTWENYTRLGIGERIYEHGAALLPEVRWRAGAQTDPAIILRRKLHAKDPWRWQSSSCTCAAAWRDFTDSDEALAAVHEPDPSRGLTTAEARERTVP